MSDELPVRKYMVCDMSDESSVGFDSLYDAVEYIADTNQGDAECDIMRMTSALSELVRSGKRMIKINGSERDQLFLVVTKTHYNN